MSDVRSLFKSLLAVLVVFFSLPVWSEIVTEEIYSTGEYVSIPSDYKGVEQRIANQYTSAFSNKTGSNAFIGDFRRFRHNWIDHNYDLTEFSNVFCLAQDTGYTFMTVTCYGRYLSFTLEEVSLYRGSGMFVHFYDSGEVNEIPSDFGDESKSVVLQNTANRQAEDFIAMSDEEMTKRFGHMFRDVQCSPANTNGKWFNIKCHGKFK